MHTHHPIFSLKRLVSFTLFIALCVCAGAQTTPRQPDLQTANDGFFDPTRPPEKPKEAYQFGMEYRIEAGYVQNEQRSANSTARGIYLHGAQLGATFTFRLPIHFALQTGLLYSIAYGVKDQHFASADDEAVQTEYIRHRVLEHAFVVPVRASYTIPLWKKLNLFFYTGPQLQIGLAQNDYMDLHLSEATCNWLTENGIHTEPYDQLADGELQRLSVRYGLGGGFEWDRYRLQAGYDFGLNNLIRQPIIAEQHLWEWGWHINFAYRL